MPQFDSWIFQASLYYLTISFYLLLIMHFIRFLPRLAAILKLRSKLLKKSVDITEDKASIKDQVSTFSRKVGPSDKNP